MEARGTAVGLVEAGVKVSVVKPEGVAAGAEAEPDTGVEAEPDTAAEVAVLLVGAVEVEGEDEA